MADACLPSPAFTIALLGAESTGKTTLAHALARHLRGAGLRVAVAGESLREWREREGRMPHPAECGAIARAQQARVEAARGSHDIVIADTTALVVALYGGLRLAGDPTFEFALDCQRAYGLNLLMGLDLPWVDDGLQRDRASREDTDALLREDLARAGVTWRVVYGRGEQRLGNALRALAEAAPALWATASDPREIERWSRLRASCEKCGDAACEHRLFTRLVRPH